MDTLKFYRGQEDVVVVEEQDYNESIFSEQYILALRQIEKMLSQPKERIPSIVAFCGDRGEGKSSCMETVRHIIGHKSDEHVADYLGAQYPTISETNFHILDTIDPAFFDERHNVLELVLGQMFSKFKERIEKYEAAEKKQKREASMRLQECFHKAKWCLTQMEKGIQAGYDPIEELDALAAGMSLREEMDRLISEYLTFFSEDGAEAEHNFLVISIDDLDLNVGEAYVMAEQIRKYLVSKQCLLLVSLKVEQLIEVIANYLNNQAAPNKSLDAPAMAAKYVTKLIPTENRVNMPKIYDLCDMQLKVYNNQEDQHPKDYNSVKEAVVQLIYMKARFLFYNSKGSVSPIVPNNLRSLRHLLGMLLNMNDFSGNEASIANKHAFKSYFYQTWTRLLSEENQRKARLLTSGSDVSDTNKLAVSILSEYIRTDKSNADSLVTQIVNPNNYSYNISVGDVFYLINFLERSNVDEELKRLLFFIKSYYSIRLYEYYDVITEQKGEMNPESKSVGEVYRSDGWFKRTNQLQRFVNGSYFTYQPDDLLPRMTLGPNEYFFRDLRVYSARTQLYKDSIHNLKSGMQGYEAMNEDEKAQFRHRFRVAEMLALCTKKSVKQKERGTHYSVPRDFAEPYYLTNYHKSTGYLVFDIMAPFYNLVNLKYTYGRFVYLSDETHEEKDFYHFAYNHDWSLLRRMIEHVRLKEYNEGREQKITIEQLPAMEAGKLKDCFMRLISNGAIRNGDVLLAMMENTTSRRANMHNTKDHLDCIREFYKDIINSEMRTYRNSRTEPPYIIRFAYLDALIELLNDAEEGELFRNIYTTGLEKIDRTIDEIYRRFGKFFNSFTNSKKNTAIIDDMHKLYPSEASRLTSEQWQKMFPVDKQYKKEFIAKAFAEVMTEMVGAETQYEEDIED